MSAWLRSTALAAGVWLLAPGATPGADPPAIPTVETLVQRVSDSWDAVHLELIAKMTTVRPERPDTEVEIRIRRAGGARTRIDFLSPARDRGKVILQIGDETWLYLPRAGRVVEVPARRNPLAGGVLFEDLFPGAPEPDEASVEIEDDHIVLVTHGRKKAQNRIHFDRATLLPLRREVYGSSGRLIKSVHIDETRDWQGVEIPWRVRFIDHLGRGSETRIDVLAAEELGEDTDGLFDKDRLRP